MKRVLPALFVLIATVFTGCGLSHDYELAMNPPASDATPDQIFPEFIGEDQVVVNNLEFGGLECQYGKDKAIIGARLSSTDEAVAYFKQYLLPQFQAQNNNFSGTVNGQFYAKSGGDWKMFGWVNGNFAFAIKATSDDGLNQIVEAFQYIDKK